MFRVEARQISEDILKIDVSGRITYEQAPELREAILRESAATVSSLVLELEGVEKMDTAGLAVLVECMRLSRARGQRLLLCQPSRSVLRIFKLAGLQDALASCCSDPEEIHRRLMG